MYYYKHHQHYERKDHLYLRILASNPHSFPFSPIKKDLLTGPSILPLQSEGVPGTPGGADLFAGSLTHPGPLFIHYQQFSINTHINSL